MDEVDFFWLGKGHTPLPNMVEVRTGHTFMCSGSRRPLDRISFLAESGLIWHDRMALHVGFYRTNAWAQSLQFLTQIQIKCTKKL